MLALLVHAGATLYMTGLIWFVQVVHYPLFEAVERSAFTAYERRHVDLTGLVVGPAMPVELASAVWLLRSTPAGVPRGSLWIGLGLLAAIWLSTAFLQVPRHNQLSAGFNADAHAALVATNWIRTVAWSARALLSLWMINQAWERTN